MEQNIEEIKQEIDKFFKLKEYQKVVDCCTDELCKLDLCIQSRKIKSLVKLRAYQKALEECNKDYYPNNIMIQSQKITILRKLRRYQEALDECHKDFCKNNSVIQSQSKILEEITKKEMENCFKPKLYNFNLYLTKLYFDDLTLEEIEALNIRAFEKSILKMAFYNKYNKEAVTPYIKTVKRNGTLSEEEVKIVNKLYNKLMKKTIFDITIYAQALKGNIDFSYIPERKTEVNTQVVVQNKVKELPIPQEKKKTEKPAKRMLVQEGKRISRFTNQTNTNQKQVEYVPQEKLLKDLFVEEIEEIQKYIYVEMNMSKNKMRAIKAWDNFENLIYKKVSDEKAYLYLCYIIDVFKKNDLIKREELVRKR